MSEVFDSIVFEQLKQQSPGMQLQAKKTLNLTESLAEYIIAKNECVGLRVVLRPRIQVAYSVDEATAKAVATVAADQIKVGLRDKGQPDWSSEDQSLREELLVAFDELENTGDARQSLLTYVQHCWDTYLQYPDDIIPCASIIQSSGYGKSQVLYQLAKETCTPDAGVRVLYTCNRMFRSTGFPATTEELRDWMLYSLPDQLALKLEAIYHYAQQNWSSVGHEWIELFVNTCAERTVQLPLLEYELKKSSTTPLSDQLNKEIASSKKVVVLAVDSAGGLLERNRRGLDYTCLLRKAAIEANKNIRKLNREGGIFVIFVDRNLKVAGLSPSKSEIAHQGSAKVFPPFVLTHNLDVYWKRYCSELNLADDEVAAYKRVVLQHDRYESLKSLQAMGRPLWGSSLYAKLEIHQAQFTRGSTSGVIWSAMEDTIKLGAAKLLAGQYMWSDKSYSEASMFGVAAMFCRLGVQFESGYVRAPFLVSHLMATLSCTSRDGTKQLVGYPSDPMLALSAAHVWYGFEYDSEGCPLTKYILPQFQKHLNRLDLEVKSASELVARIVLLLAMDACVVTKTGSQQYPFRGQFVDVNLFIQALGGGTQAPLLKSTMATASEATRTTILEAWHAKWSGWKCGFCQFVEMHDEPTEDLLWVLLGRRAAGISLGDEGGADLLVPMFNGEEVLFLFVQVEGAKERENEFPVCVMEEMQPTRVFSDSNPLRGKAPGDIIRVCMNLNESASLEKPDKFFVYDENEGIQVAVLEVESKESEVAAAAALTLCVHSLRPWTLAVDEKSFPVVTETVSTLLTQMVKIQTRSQLMKSYGRDAKKPTESPFTTHKKSQLGPLIMSDDERLQLISQMAQSSNSSCGLGADQSLLPQSQANKKRGAEEAGENPKRQCQ